jgi:hypothetical protein
VSREPAPHLRRAFARSPIVPAAGIRTVIEYGGMTVVGTRDALGWHVQVGNAEPVSSRLLDVALEAAFPYARRSELDRLTLRLLSWSMSRADDADEPPSPPASAFCPTCVSGSDGREPHAESRTQ